MNEDVPSRASQSWRLVLALLALTSAVEAIGVSQVFAFMPLYLETLGLPKPEVGRWVGALNGLVFVFGLPLVPLWGVWADKYSRKAVIIRSTLVEGLVFGLVAMSREPWQFAASLMLAGFQLGNTGVMLAALRDLVPRQRLGTAIALFGASSPIGFALGPAIGGVMVDQWHTSLSAVFLLSAVISLAVAVLLMVWFHEVRPQSVPTGRTLHLAYGALRGVLTEPATRRLFTIFGIALLARQISSPFMPLLVQHLNGDRPALASAVALVVGTAALVGGLMSPAAGAIGDRVGFRRVLAVSLAGLGIGLAAMPLAPDVSALAVLNTVCASLAASVTAMIFGLLALEVPAERRSATLNLVYLPLYIAGIIGPSIGALVVSAGLPVIFVLAGVTELLGVVPLALGRSRQTTPPQ